MEVIKIICGVLSILLIVLMIYGIVIIILSPLIFIKKLIECFIYKPDENKEI